MGDFEVWALAAWAFDVGVCSFGDEVYGFLCGAVEMLLVEFPGVAAVSAFQRGLGCSDVEFGVFEFVGFELLEREPKDFVFHLLEFADFQVDCCDFAEFLFVGDFRSRFQNCFGKCPFVHG